MKREKIALLLLPLCLVSLSACGAQKKTIELKISTHYYYDSKMIEEISGGSIPQILSNKTYYVKYVIDSATNTFATEKEVNLSILVKNAKGLVYTWFSAKPFNGNPPTYPNGNISITGLSLKIGVGSSEDPEMYFPFIIESTNDVDSETISTTVDWVYSDDSGEKIQGSPFAFYTAFNKSTKYTSLYAVSSDLKLDRATGIFTWSACENADHYIALIDGKNVREGFNEPGDEKIIVDREKYAGKHVFSYSASSDRLNIKNSSEISKDFNVLEKPDFAISKSVNSLDSSETFSWTSSLVLPTNNFYGVVVDDVTVGYDHPDSRYDMDAAIKRLPAGKHLLSIFNSSSVDGDIDSLPSTAVPLTVLNAPVVTKNLPNISWDAIPAAEKYQIFLNGVATATTNNTYYPLPGTLGVKTVVTVKALNSSQGFVSSAPSNPIDDPLI